MNEFIDISVYCTSIVRIWTGIWYWWSNLDCPCITAKRNQHLSKLEL